MIVSVTYGTNDISTWEIFGAQIASFGLGPVYDKVRLFNHPPLMGLWASSCYSFSQWSQIRFEWVFKAPMVLADAGVAWLIYSIWKRGSAQLGVAAFALFFCNPISILVTSYHGNTDSLCAGLALLAAVLIDAQWALGAGLALAASINVKLIPVLLIPPLFACTQDRRQTGRFLLGLSFGVLPFLPLVIRHWRGFHEHVLSYRSSSGLWGITGILDQVGQNQRFANICGTLSRFWENTGPLAVLFFPILLAVMRNWTNRHWSALQLAACSMVGFVVLTPGWGIQYVVYPVALLFAVNLESALWYSVVGGLYATVAYVSCWTGVLPFYSLFQRGHPPGGWLLGYLTWIVAVRVLFDLLRTRRPTPPVRSRPSEMPERPPRPLGGRL